MKSFPIRQKPTGGVMVIALVAICFTTVAFSAWVGLLAQRGRSAEVEEHAARRRISTYNSRSAIREYVFTRMITSSGDTSGVSFDPFEDSADVDDNGNLKEGWTITTAAAWAGYPMESNTRLAGLNGFSPTWDYPYSKVIDVTAATKSLGFVTSGSGRVEQSLSDSASYLKTYVRSRSPVLGGDLLILHRSKLTTPVDPAVSGNVSVNGRVMHFVPEMTDTAYTALSARFIARPGTSPMQLRPKDLSGNAIPPSNLAWSPITFGRVGGITDLTGKLNVIDDSTNGGNSLRQKLVTSAATLQNGGGTALTDPRGYSNDGGGTVTVTPCVGPTNPADLPSVVIDSEVSELVIEGQDGTNFTSYSLYRPALAVVYVQDAASSRQLQTIRLKKQNRRRMILALKHEGDAPGPPVNVIVEDVNAISEWHLVILAENMPLVFSAASPVTVIKIAGGIQTDSPLTGPGTGQDLNLVLEDDTRGLIKLTPRAAWVETIMPDKIPGTANDNTW
jgi:hypothetical protein